MAIGGIVAQGGNGRGRMDTRVHLGKKRAQDLLRKADLLEPTEKTIRGGGEIDAIRAAVAQGEGFVLPVNYEISFNPPLGIGSSGRGRSRINPGGLDAQTHLLNRSTTSKFREVWGSASKVGESNWNPDAKQTIKDKISRKVRKIDIYCSKVSIPDRTIAQGLYRHYGSTFAYPNQAMQYGTLTTTFYCDATMHIKKFFDAWQALIFNTQTGNFNYYNEYTSSFDVFTRSSVGAGEHGEEKKGSESLVDKIQGGIKKATAAVDEFFGSDTATKDRVDGGNIPKINFTRTYGCRVFECWPQVVGGVDLSHDGGGSIATFDVTWAYHKWSPFRMEGVGNRSNINLNVGLMRNEKDGIPFLEDLPPELAGPIGGAAQQAFNTSPASKASNIFG